MRSAAASRTFVLAAVIFCFIPPAATAGTGPDGTTPARPPAAGAFTTGVSLALTGPFAEYGVAVKRGIELAQFEHPEKFAGVKFIFEDDGYEPKRTVAALAKFKDVDSADLVFIWGNEPALGAAPVSERRKIPTVVVAQHPQAGAGYKYVVRFINPAEDFSLALLNYLRRQPAYLNSPAPHRFDVVKAEISFFNTLLDEFQKGLNASETLNIVDQFLPGDMDFHPVILKLKAQQLQYLGVYLIPPQVGPFFRQAKELDFHPQVFGATPFESSQVISSALGEMEGAVYAHLAALPDFIDRYKRRYGDDVQVAYAAQAYDFAVITADLFGQPPFKPAADTVIKKLTSIGEREGSLGKFRVKKDTSSGTYFEFPVAVKQIKDGKIVVVETAP